MFFIDLLARIISVLRSAASTRQIAAGFVLGMSGGLSPSLPIRLLITLLLFIVNVNATAGLLALFVFGAAAYLLDALLHWLGYVVLVASPLQPLWTALYNTPFIPLTRFNNTVVMGGIVLSAILAVPVYFLVKRGIVVYREKYDQKLRESRLFRYMRASRFYKTYQTIRRLGAVRW